MESQAPGARSMGIGIRLFVGVVFLALAAAFIGLTALLMHEFERAEWFSLAAFDSQLFIFFPVFGLMALLAFYRPACVVIDIYCRQVSGGVAIIVGAFFALIVVSAVLAQAIRGAPLLPWEPNTQEFEINGLGKSLWDLQPQVLTGDRGEFCPQPELERDEVGQPVPAEPGECERLPFLDALGVMRELHHESYGMSSFVRNCRPNTLIETPEEELERRFCFVNKTLETAAECCTAQRRFAEATEEAYADQGEPSLTAQAYKKLLPFHVFFLLTIFLFGVGLVRRGSLLDLPVYDPVRRSVEARILAGAAVMLFWPLLNHALLQSADLMYGNRAPSVFRTLVPVFTAMFGAWLLMLVFFYFRAFPEAVRNVGQIGGVIVSAIAFLRFDEIVDILARTIGVGSDEVSLVVVVIAVVLVVAIIIASRRMQPVRHPTGPVQRGE